MKTFIIFISVISLLVPAVHAQSITDIRFEYDSAGNRTSRIIYYDSGGQKSTEAETFVEEPEFDKGLNVYPNPATHSIYVTLNEEVLQSRRKVLYVFDSLGKLISQINMLEETNQIYVSDWPSGTYILKLIYDDKHNEWIIIKK